MAGLFAPKVPAPVIPVSPSDTANRINGALVNRLAQGGTNADTVPGSGGGNVGGGRLPTLSGLNG